MLFFKKYLFTFLFISSISCLNIYSEKAYSEELEQEQKQEQEYKYYDVEVVLFKQSSNHGLNSEYWNSVEDDQNNSSQNKSSNSPEIKPITAKLANYSVNSRTFIPHSNLVSYLPPQNYKLTKEANHLRY